MPKQLDGKFYGVLYRQRDNQLEPPDGWMVFVARDNALPATLDFYWAECKRLGAAEVQLAAIDDLRDCVMSWRERHADQCKVPDVQAG
jgi:hypothetical protein